MSDHILDELARTLRKPYFAVHFTPGQIERAWRTFRKRGDWTLAIAAVTGVASHPEDDVVLAIAVSAAADYLVTGDRQLQRLSSYQGVKIVSPRDFLTLLEQLEQDDEIVP